MISWLYTLPFFQDKRVLFNLYAHTIAVLKKNNPLVKYTTALGALSINIDVQVHCSYETASFKI